MTSVLRTDATNADFKTLVKQLNAYLKITDGDEHDYYNQFNGIEHLKNVVIIYNGNVAVGCGAFKPYDATSVEIKRMYVNPDVREKGIGKQILSALEEWAKELGYCNAILETGKRQVEAVKFYQKCNYQFIPKYGQYKIMENSLCFKKDLNYDAKTIQKNG